MAGKNKTVDAWRKEQQDPAVFQKLEWLRDFLFFASISIAIGFYLNPSLPWLLACLACLTAVFVLALLLPAYFTLMDVCKENKDGPQHGITLSGVLCFASVPLMTRQYYQVKYEWQLVLATLVLVMAVMGLLFRFSVDRMSGGTAILVVVLVGICGYCGLNHVNALLDFSKPVHYRTVVLERNLSSSGGRRGSYSCMVAGENGETVSIEVSEEIYDQLQCGGPVCLDSHTGALGIEYMDIHIVQ